MDSSCYKFKHKFCSKKFFRDFSSIFSMIQTFFQQGWPFTLCSLFQLIVPGWSQWIWRLMAFPTDRAGTLPFFLGGGGGVWGAWWMMEVSFLYVFCTDLFWFQLRKVLLYCWLTVTDHEPLWESELSMLPNQLWWLIFAVWQGLMKPFQQEWHPQWPFRQNNFSLDKCRYLCIVPRILPHFWAWFKGKKNWGNSLIHPSQLRRMWLNILVFWGHIHRWSCPG